MPGASQHKGEANLLIGDFPQALQTARQLKSKQVAADLAQTFNKSLACLNPCALY
jgi:hypothetical protein